MPGDVNTGAESSAKSTTDNTPPQLDNAAWKAHPLTIKVTTELAELRREREAASEAAKAAESAAAVKAAEGAQNYEKATEMKVAEAVAAARKEADRDRKRQDAVLELVKLGITNDDWLSGAVAKFDPDKQSAAEFAKAKAEEDGTKALLAALMGGSNGGIKPRQKDVHGAPPGLPSDLSTAELQKLTASPDPNERAKAYAIAEANFDKTGKTGLR